MNEGMLKSALIGGVLLGVLSAVPVIKALNCFCCAWVIGGGILAAHLYVKSAPFAVTLGQGVGLGLMAGIIGAVVDTIFSIPLSILLSRMGFGMAEMREMFERIPSLPPETREALRTVFAKGGPGVLFELLAGVFKVIIYGLMAMMGGAIGVAIFEKRKLRPDTTQATVAYQPPTEPPANI